MYRLRKLSLGGRLVLALAVGGGVFGLASAVQASIPDAGGVIHGCYNTSLAHGSPTGALRVIDTAKPNGNCASSEEALNWSAKGVTGATGATGPPGPTGATGPTGPTGPTEGVAATSSLGTPPTSLTNDFGISATSTFTTTVSGKLSLSKPITGFVNCSGDSGGVWWWITLDGNVVTSSFTRTDTTTTDLSQTLVGVTAASVPAGSHTMDVGGMCFGGTHVGSGAFTYSAGTAVVLGG